MKKVVIVGVSGGIAAYKACDLVSKLKKRNYDVHVIMTKNACEFVTPLTFETLSKNRVSIDTFDRNFQYDVEHISLAKKADCFIIAPATANVIAKVVNGIADDMLTTTFLAATCPKIICPAMNTNMLENVVTQNNLQKCKDYGYTIVESATGLLACNDIGKGRLADVDDLLEAIEKALETNKYLLGKRVLVSAGASVEAIDPIRFISNHSTGKMGVSIAHVAARLGAEVILVGNTKEYVAPWIKYIKALSAQEMYDAIIDNFDQCDYLIMSAAVADYKCLEVADEKIKKSDDELFLQLTRTIDILKYCGEHKTHQKLIGFAMETSNLINYAKQKLEKKNLDLIVANDLKIEGAGFKGDTNVVTLIDKESECSYPIMSKIDVAYKIFEKVGK